jgi:hypothetical protein
MKNPILIAQLLVSWDQPDSVAIERDIEETRTEQNEGVRAGSRFLEQSCDRLARRAALDKTANMRRRGLTAEAVEDRVFEQDRVPAIRPQSVAQRHLDRFLRSHAFAFSFRRRAASASANWC